MRLFFIVMLVVRKNAWICLSWFWLEEHDCNRVVKVFFVKKIGGIEHFWVRGDEKLRVEGNSSSGRMM
jgi:hypothetical protein